MPTLLELRLFLFVLDTTYYAILFLIGSLKLQCSHVPLAAFSPPAPSGEI